MKQDYQGLTGDRRVIVNYVLLCIIIIIIIIIIVYTRETDEQQTTVKNEFYIVYKCLDKPVKYIL